MTRQESLYDAEEIIQKLAAIGTPTKEKILCIIQGAALVSPPQATEPTQENRAG